MHTISNIIKTGFDYEDVQIDKLKLDECVRSRLPARLFLYCDRAIYLQVGDVVLPWLSSGQDNAVSVTFSMTFIFLKCVFSHVKCRIAIYKVL